MKKNWKLFLTLGIILIALAGIFVVDRLSKRVPQNPEGTIGNTASNLNNGGLFCEDDGVVYFANSYDSDSIYCMNPDETEVKKLVSAQVQFINAGSENLYYYMKDSANSSGLGFIRRVMGVYRCNKKGKKIQTISRDPVAMLALSGNELYSQHYDNTHGITFYRCGTDGKNAEYLSTDIINPSCIVNGKVYYNDNAKSHFLYSYDLTTKSTNLILRYNMWNPCLVGDYVYFMDTDNNYRLCRYNMNTETIDILSSDRVDCFNVAGEYVYYQKNSADTPALKRVSTDGSREEVVSTGNYWLINSTSKYVYFRSFSDNQVTYRTPVNGDVNVKEFTAALYAAVDNQ